MNECGDGVERKQFRPAQGFGDGPAMDTGETLSGSGSVILMRFWFGSKRRHRDACAHETGTIYLY
jgi:hypothetical protein